MRAEEVNLVSSVHKMDRHATMTSEEERLPWDISLSDKVLSIFTPIILLMFGMLLLFLVRPIMPTRPSVECYWPKEFPDSWILYGESRCRSDDLYTRVPNPDYNSSIPPSGLPPGGLTPGGLTPPSQPYIVVPYQDSSTQWVWLEATQTFAGTLLILSALCLLPMLSWRVLGTIDGRELLRPAQAPYNNNKELSEKLIKLWVIITKISPVVLSFILLITMCVLKLMSTAYLTEISRSPDESSTDNYCDFWIRRMGGNQQRYTVQCVITASGDDGVSKSTYKVAQEALHKWAHILSPILSALVIWCLGVVMLQLTALISTLHKAKICRDNKHARLYSLSRFTDHTLSVDSIEIVDSHLGWTGLFVALLSASNGSQQQTKAYIKQAGLDAQESRSVDQGRQHNQGHVEYRQAMQMT